MRIIIDLDEQGGVLVERHGESGDARDPLSVSSRIPAPSNITVTDAGRPPAWLLRALGVAPAPPRAASEVWEGEDAGAARA